MADQKHTKEPWTHKYGPWLVYPKANRIVACVNALAGVDDPVAFMRDVREWREALSAYQEDESHHHLPNLAKYDVIVSEHLKGGE